MALIAHGEMFTRTMQDFRINLLEPYANEASRLNLQMEAHILQTCLYWLKLEKAGQTTSIHVLLGYEDPPAGCKTLDDGVYYNKYMPWE